MPGFQTKALVVTPTRGDNLRLIPPNCMVSQASVLRHCNKSKIPANLRISCERKLLTLVKNQYLSTLSRSSLKSQLILPLRMRRTDSEKMLPQDKELSVSEGCYSSAVFLPQNYAVCIQRHALSTGFCYSYGVTRLCCYCQHGNRRRGTKGLSHLTG